VFPFNIRGQVTVPSLTLPQAQTIIANFERALVQVRASGVSIAGNRLTFRAGIFRLVSNMNILAFVGSGTVDVQPGSPGTVNFHFSCLQSLLVTTGMVSFVAAMLASGPNSVAVRFWVPVAAWLWLFGANYLISNFRLWQFVRDVIAESFPGQP